MANKLAVFKFTLSYPAPGGGTNQVPSTTISAPFLAQSEGTIDVADTTPMATAFTIPFGAIEDGATLLIVVNKTTQELVLKINGGDVTENIAVNEAAVYVPGTVLGATPITDASVTTTATVAGAGSVDYLVFGDPE